MKIVLSPDEARAAIEAYVRFAMKSETATVLTGWAIGADIEVEIPDPHPDVFVGYMAKHVSS